MLLRLAKANCQYCAAVFLATLAGNKGIEPHRVVLLAVWLESAMKPKRKAVQLAMHCRCGREAVLAHGMCATCYTLRRLRDAVDVSGRRLAFDKALKGHICLRLLSRGRS